MWRRVCFKFRRLWHPHVRLSRPLAADAPFLPLLRSFFLAMHFLRWVHGSASTKISLAACAGVCSVDFIVHAERDSSSIAHMSLCKFYIYLLFYLRQFAHRFRSKAQRPRVGLCCAWPIVCLLSTGSDMHTHAHTGVFFLALCSAMVSLDESTALVQVHVQ